MSDGTDIYTNLGLSKIRTAAGSGSQVRISHVALGDGNGAAYAPDHAQTALRREIVRQPIERRHQVEPNAWRIKAEFGPDTAAFRVREMAFIDEDGDVIALWAGLNVGVRETGVITYLVDHVLQFGGIDDGLVVVAAPDDELFDFAVAMLEEQASQRVVLFNLTEAFRTEHGHYPGDA